MRLTVVSVLCLFLTACVSIPQGAQLPSPLQVESPLKFQAPTLDTPGLVYRPEQTNHVYVPGMNQSGPCGMNLVAAGLARLFVADPGQQRLNPVCDARLVLAAQYRADDMVKRQYFGHFDPDGHGANYWVSHFGCKLPDYYPANSNNVESIALNYPTYGETWAALLLSKYHRIHVLGLIDFYKEQTFYGMGYSEGDYGKVYVIITTPKCG